MWASVRLFAGEFQEAGFAQDDAVRKWGSSMIRCLHLILK